ncbi:hypothetical protein DAEQUDRAFT_129423 [Daedalea quercina L-15889]|uniref:Uncharacterized protein n=1 Tax=Daedalea quercina L-15889 TaxID=1314783 RepID=A0A165S182_9APHY|nr:hypothetical protein DAEQUDRAFT_129423 [Daedalea quercina L-15889]
MYVACRGSLGDGDVLCPVGGRPSYIYIPRCTPAPRLYHLFLHSQHFRTHSSHNSMSREFDDAASWAGREVRLPPYPRPPSIDQAGLINPHPRFRPGRRRRGRRAPLRQRRARRLLRDARGRAGRARGRGPIRVRRTSGRGPVRARRASGRGRLRARGRARRRGRTVRRRALGRRRGAFNSQSRSAVRCPGGGLETEVLTRLGGWKVGSAERGVKDVGEGIVDAIGGAVGWAARKVSSRSSPICVVP